MMASLGFLSTLVTAALAIVVVSPVILLVLLLRDWKKRALW